MTAGPLITVHDRTSFSAHVSPEQAAAYVRAKLQRWGEAQAIGSINFYRVTRDLRHPVSLVVVPRDSDPASYSRRMVELVDALVSLGCAPQPSVVLAAMAAIHCERTAPAGDGCWLGPKHAGECRSHAEMGEP